jgi:hypothetical protein
MVKTQTIPVSTVPSGAQVLVDGAPKCTTPCRVDLACTEDHIISVRKAGFEEQDIIIRRQYEKEQVLVRAINSGVNSGMFFNDVGWGVSSGLQSVAAQEQTGHAYSLIPAAVSIRLQPDNPQAEVLGPNAQSKVHKALTAENDPLQFMDVEDESFLEDALESGEQGEVLSWENSQSKIVYAVVPGKAEYDQARLVRPFTIGMDKDGKESLRHHMAYRVGRGEWIVDTSPKYDGPARTAQTQNPGIDRKKMIRALGELKTPPIMEKKKTLSSSESVSTKKHSDGSISRTKRSTSVSAGVSVGPGAVFKILDALDF